MQFILFVCKHFMIIVLILLDLRVILNNNSGVKYNFVDQVITGRAYTKLKAIIYCLIPKTIRHMVVCSLITNLYLVGMT